MTMILVKVSSGYLVRVLAAGRVKCASLSHATEESAVAWAAKEFDRPSLRPISLEVFGGRLLVG